MPAVDTAAHFFIAVAVVLAASVTGGSLAVRFRQPRVVGELTAGILLGPTLLGALAPSTASWLFPQAVLPMLDGLAHIGLAVFVFGVGQELAGLRSGTTGRAGVLATLASLLVPVLGGVLVAALLLADGFGVAEADRTTFVLFVGCALGVTAVPVLARLLTDTGLQGSRPGRLSLFAAAVGDGFCWLLLATVLAVAGGGGPVRIVVGAVVGVVLLVVAMGPGRRLLARYAATWSEPVTVAALVGLVAATSALTASVGLHELIGALLVGLAWPRSGTPAAVIEPVLRTGSRVLLPFFFVGFGLDVDLTGAFRGEDLVMAAVLLVVAAGTKIFGPGLAAYVGGMGWRDSLTLGVLLNARGLTELVLLRIGYEAGLIDARALGVLTLVALVTTAMTGPLLRAVGHRERAQEVPVAAPSGVPVA